MQKKLLIKCSINIKNNDENQANSNGFCKWFFSLYISEPAQILILVFETVMLINCL